MSKEDTTSIKYVLDELDPAEKVEFERKMMSDPDLRIEVESVRRMKSKLNTLPDLYPPQHLSDSILSFASEQSNKKRSFRTNYLIPAAIVILGLTAGSLILNNSFEERGNASNASAAFSSYGNELTQQDNSQPEDLKPWVDRKDVLHLSGYESISSQINQNNEGSSLNKLRPVGKYPGLQPFGRSVQLTGSNR